MSWDNQRRSKAERLQAAAALCCGKTVATGDIVKLMEAVTHPGDKVVLEGDNQKQAAFLAASLAEVDPKVVHDLTMIIPSISRSEHLDYFEKGIASTVDFAFAGTQAQRLSEMLAEGKVKIGNFNTYLEIYARLFVDLIPNVCLVAADKADKDGNLFTGYSTEETPTLVEAAACKSGIVIAQVNEIVEDLPRVDIPGGWVDFIVPADKPYPMEPLFTRDPQFIKDADILMGMMVIKGSGGEGKSQIGVVLSRLFGCNMKDGSIGKISENRFARADLEHTLLCVDDDMRMEALRQTNYVKSIVTAQGQMDLERKGKQSYQGWMYARLLAFSNGDLQALYDRSDGFYRRQLILTTKDKPLSRVDDPDIAEKMAAEVEGILLWAFEGLQRLVKNGFQFTESDRAKRNRELVKRDNNNVFDFLESEGYIRLKADASTSSKELYEVYKMWCEENSLNAIKSRGFSDALIANQRRYNLEHTNNIINSSGRRVRGFVGIEALVQPDLTPNGWRT